MHFQNRRQKMFFMLATIVAWGGFAISHQLQWRKEEEEMDRFLEGMHQQMADYARANENFQRRLGCKGEVLMGSGPNPSMAHARRSADSDRPQLACPFVAGRCIGEPAHRDEIRIQAGSTPVAFDSSKRFRNRERPSFELRFRVTNLHPSSPEKLAQDFEGGANKRLAREPGCFLDRSHNNG